MTKRWGLAVAFATITMLSSGCAPASDHSEVGSGVSPAAADVSAECDAAFSAASDAMNLHYDTHPMYGSEYDALYEDGQLTASESDELQAMMADEEEQFARAIDPIYDACTGVEELYSGAFAHRDQADWALLDVPSMTTDEVKKIFIVSHCSQQRTRPACSDYDEDEWR